MNLFHLTSVLLFITALFGYINQRWLKFPDVIGMTALGLLASSLLAVAGHYDPTAVAWAHRIVSQINFPETIFHGLLAFLLFAGALSIDLDGLARQKWAIFLLATLGVVISTFVAGGLFWLALRAVQIDAPWLLCLLFGALISPTDPVAVLSILKHAKVSPSLEMKIAGESLFNDGTAVVIFLVLVGMLQGSVSWDPVEIAEGLLVSVSGGVITGMVTGFVGRKALSRLDSYAVEVLVTLALATGSFTLAEALHVSAPIAVVVAGLFIGHYGRQSQGGVKRISLFKFWDLSDELLNLLLFGLVGIELVAMSFHWDAVLAGLLAIPIVLSARLISVAFPLWLMKRLRPLPPHAVKLLTWGGLRGGISIAMALSLPAIPGRDMIVTATYLVVVFSLLVQGMTLGPMARRLAETSSGSGEAIK